VPKANCNFAQIFFIVHAIKRLGGSGVQMSAKHAELGVGLIGDRKDIEIGDLGNGGGCYHKGQLSWGLKKD